MKGRIKGGVHPLKTRGEGKLSTRDEAIREYIAESVTIPVAMQLGSASEPCVSVGDRVKKYQVIARASGALGLDVHASVSGEVVDISKKQQLSGSPLCITIKNDFEDEAEQLDAPCGADAPPEQIIAAIKKAGICGQGGAAFPAHVKLTLREGQHCDVIIVNGAECETFITADDRLMREQPGRIAAGLRAAMRAAGVERGIIAVEDNKPEAVKSLSAVAKEGIELKILKTKYPQGGEKQLIKAVTGREVGRGKLPIDSGVVVLNAGTVAAIYDAVELGIPFTERVTTVTGCVRTPSNLRLRIGTLVSDAVGACGGYTCESPAKIVCGGGMMGIAAPSEAISIVKATNGLVVMNEKEADLPDETACIRCGRCVEACPMGLMPFLMRQFYEKNDIAAAVKNNVKDCILCGCCTFVCPSKRYLSASFRHLKDSIAAMARREAGK